MSRKGKKKQSSMPASSAGLLRFFEDETHGVKVRPEIVIILAIVMAVSSLLIRMFIPV
ncbi:MAG TPA: preprotein translocase subunit Sec61beta [Nitrososphaerales archaeon]|nr:preprotein translocase subunit Sec61beta [Nitrososphaerales archaeon]